MKRIGMLAICAALLALTAAPALAQGVGIELDGVVYTFYVDREDGAPEDFARCEIDGKTFLVGEDEVIVQEEGKPDRHFPLGDATQADVTVTDEAASDSTEFMREATATASDAGGEARFDCYTFEEEDAVSGKPWSLEDAAEYAAFAPYGLSCDAKAGKLYYQGVPVRIFQDSHCVDGGTAELNYFDERGEVDVHSVRNAQGELTGLEALDEAAFAARDLRPWTDPAPTYIGVAVTDGNLAPGVAEDSVYTYVETAATDEDLVPDADGDCISTYVKMTASDESLAPGAVSDPERVENTATTEGEMTPEECAAFFAPYAPFGLRYDAATDRLYLGERPVRNFLDVRRSNGEPMGGGNFHGSLTQVSFDGEVDVTALRDYAHPDANGEGKLIGLEVTEAK